MSETYSDAPREPFFLFGMGPRRKLLYKAGRLSDARTGDILRAWDVERETISPAAYEVSLRTCNGQDVTIREDEQAVRVREGKSWKPVTEGAIKLPDFTGHPFRDRLRVLHHEILMNVVNGRPLPNLFVYDRPWHRDGAMMAMVLERTGNLCVLRDWVLSIRDPFDRNNGGHAEPDNLGQVLYLVSLVADRSHPAVAAVLGEIPRFRKNGHVEGMSDSAPHPVYQTKWLKFGLRCLGLDDCFIAPAVADTYDALFWWDYRDRHADVAGFRTTTRHRYPYLAWAEDHFHCRGPDWDLCGRGYPLTWEAHASQARYEGMAALGAAFPAGRFCMPHTWHAAEMFLYLTDERTRDRRDEGREPSAKGKAQ